MQVILVASASRYPRFNQAERNAVERADLPRQVQERI
jgi:hypothetical protein